MPCIAWCYGEKLSLGVFICAWLNPSYVGAYVWVWVLDKVMP